MLFRKKQEEKRKFKTRESREGSLLSEYDSKYEFEIKNNLNKKRDLEQVELEKILMDMYNTFNKNVNESYNYIFEIVILMRIARARDAEVNKKIKRSILERLCFLEVSYLLSNEEWLIKSWITEIFFDLHFVASLHDTNTAILFLVEETEKRYPGHKSNLELHEEESTLDG